MGILGGLLRGGKEANDVTAVWGRALKCGRVVPSAKAIREPGSMLQCLLETNRWVGTAVRGWYSVMVFASSELLSVEMKGRSHRGMQRGCAVSKVEGPGM
jgi:hypothetical protein